MSAGSGFGDAEAKRIIRRAAEIDAERGQELDVVALREIASEAGISPLAVDKALEEREVARLAAATRLPWFKRHRTLLTFVAILTVLFFVFAVARTVVPPHP